MRKKIALLSLLSVLVVALVAVPAAQASYLSVFVKVGRTDGCRPTPDTLSYRLAFTADVTAVSIAKPKKVRVGFQVVNRDTKRVLRSGVVNLKRSKGYKAESPRFTANADEKLSYNVNISYESGGKTRKKKANLKDQIPSLSYMDALGVPSC